MAFSKEIRTQALVSAARRCCVCHRYKGVKVEVHHIVPLAKGGTDSAENAIVLCFDCHADAGHYNPEHPRGTKFSPEELRLARDLWYIAVARNRIQSPEDEDRLYCRYLVCKSFSALSEIAGKNLANIPVTEPFLASTTADEFLNELIRRHPESYRHSHIWGDSFADRAAYEHAHPTIRVFERPNINLFPYFEASRVPSRDELIARVAPKDSVTSLLLQSNVPVQEICEAFAYEEVCGGGGFQETYRLRPLWGVFLVATNITSTPIRIHSLVSELESPDGAGYRVITERVSAKVVEVALPRMPLAPGATAVIPVATVLGPMGELPIEVARSDSRDVTTGEVQAIAHCDASSYYGRLAAIGPALWPCFFNTSDGGRQEIHQVDLSNLYIIDRHWEAGCCPHLFLENAADSSLAYWGELWASAPDVVQTVYLTVPLGIGALVVAELESELAYLKEISVNGRTVVGDIVLRPNEHLRVTVKSGDQVCLVGHYAPYPAARAAGPDPWHKNSIVAHFIRRHYAHVSHTSAFCLTRSGRSTTVFF